MEPQAPVAQKKPWPRMRVLAVGAVIFAVLATATVCLALVHYSSVPKTPGTTPPSSLAAPKVSLALYATGLANPTSIVSTGQKTDTRLFVLDQSGIVRIVKSDGTVAAEPFLDMHTSVTFSGEMGLLGLAFSPQYATDHTFFVDYIDTAQNTVVAKYTVSADASKADPASGQTVLTLKQPYPNHNGGDLAFGPDGYLYIALGDGGGAGDPQDRAQNLGILFGKILRLDVSALPYKIPATNPFAKQTGAAPEVWDYGLRNPWKISFDSKTGELYIADVGQGAHEEINVEPAGSKGSNNYGWRCYEAAEDYNLGGCKSKDRYVFPVAEYDHSNGRCSITGGSVYRGRQYPALASKYFYADYCSGDVYILSKTTGGWQSKPALKTPYKITTFGTSSQGELYTADATTGSLYHIQDSANPAH